MNTIKDQLLKLGLKSQPESEKLPNLKDSSKVRILAQSEHPFWF